MSWGWGGVPQQPISDWGGEGGISPGPSASVLAVEVPVVAPFAEYHLRPKYSQGYMYPRLKTPGFEHLPLPSAGFGLEPACGVETRLQHRCGVGAGLKEYTQA